MLNVKTYLVVVLAIAANALNAQHKCLRTVKVYFTEQAFKNDSASAEHCLTSYKDMVYINGFEQLVIDSKDYRKYERGTIVAYAINNTTYWFYDDDKFFGKHGFFKIEDTTGLIIYTMWMHRHTRPNVYYSKKLGGKIGYMSIRHLKQDGFSKAFIEGFKRLRRKGKENNYAEINVLYNSTIS